jgi:hypothetical protein
MATVRKDFDAYKIYYYSGFTYEALIECFKAGVLVGRMVFFKDGSVPPNKNYASGPSIHFGLSRFGDVAETLRHETPLYLFLNGDTLTGMLATTELEPTGMYEQS